MHGNIVSATILLSCVWSVYSQSNQCLQDANAINNACSELDQCFSYTCVEDVCSDGVPLYNLCSDSCVRQINATSNTCRADDSVSSLVVSYCSTSPRPGVGASCEDVTYVDFCTTFPLSSSPDCPTPESTLGPAPATEPSSIIVPSQTFTPDPSIIAPIQAFAPEPVPAQAFAPELASTQSPTLEPTMAPTIAPTTLAPTIAPTTMAPTTVSASSSSSESASSPTPGQAANMQASHQMIYLMIPIFVLLLF